VTKATLVPLSKLPASDHEGLIHVVIETRKGSRVKYAYQPEGGYFLREFALPEGMSFPFDFGFIPSTKADDGDPLDILVLADTPLEMGCVLKARLLGAIKANQKEKGKTKVRNDRLIAVAQDARGLLQARKLSDLPKGMVDEITEFFVQYNRLRDKKFFPIGDCEAADAKKILRKAQRNK